MLNELDKIFESETIKPTFDYVHIILALFIFGKAYPKGVGRYRLKEELNIGDGTAKSLIKKLNRKMNFISVSKEGIRRGHVLTNIGLNFLQKLKNKIPVLEEGDSSIFKDIIINTENINPYFCQIKDSSEKLTNGLMQRDAAVKVNGKGATCLVYKYNDLIFKDSTDTFNEDEKNFMKVDKQIYNYFKNFKNEETGHFLTLENNDVIIIGSGTNKMNARLATLNAALTLIE